ncbi:glycosyltransferase [Bacillus cereus]|uniref:glycosyltransferase n=1 Tax=Bacillus cereus TaxID=1396 RepID=UPI000BEE66E9|nr:glycosyltransferase [Bacillus cereus]PDY79665.1 hypothetical protein CON06_24150 [Bacillus cereus]PGL61292.1 hypothetical protein CN927_12005 [Bacillus cereus]
MKKTPFISVIMSVYNTDENYLREAIESILNQTFTNFEFIIIDDASSFSIDSVIKEYEDPRIILMRNTSNMGLAASLNKGIEVSKGKYIARMDSDDVSSVERFEKQVDFMERYKKVDILGTLAEKFGGMNGKFGYDESNEMIKARLIFNSSLIHPTCMIRRDFLISNNLKYNPHFLKAQDYELWSRCIAGELSVFPEVLLSYRVHNKQVTISGKKEQEEYGDKVRIKLINELGINPTQEEREIHYELINSTPRFKYSIITVNNWCLKLIRANISLGIFNRVAFNKVIIEYFVGYLYKVLKSDKRVISTIFRTRLFYKSLNPIYYKTYFNKIKKTK